MRTAREARSRTTSYPVLPFSLNRRREGRWVSAHQRSGAASQLASWAFLANLTWRRLHGSDSRKNLRELLLSRGPPNCLNPTSSSTRLLSPACPTLDRVGQSIRGHGPGDTSPRPL